MAEPVGRGLRAARRSGLTSPEPVRTPHGPHGHPEPRPRASNPGQAAQQASGRTPAPASTSQNSSCRNQAGNELPELAGGSRLSSDIRTCRSEDAWPGRPLFRAKLMACRHGRLIHAIRGGRLMLPLIASTSGSSLSVQQAQGGPARNGKSPVPTSARSSAGPARTPSTASAPSTPAAPATANVD